MWLANIAVPSSTEGGIVVIGGDQTVYPNNDNLPNAVCAVVHTGTPPTATATRLACKLGIHQELDAAYAEHAAVQQKQSK